MKKSKIIKKLIRKYGLKHRDLVDINTVKYIAAKEHIELNDGSLTVN